MKSLLSLPLLIPFLFGCSLTTPTNEIRITEYGAGLGITSEIAGCRVVQEGEVSVEIEYAGETCFVRKLATSSTNPEPPIDQDQ